MSTNIARKTDSKMEGTLKASKRTFHPMSPLIPGILAVLGLTFVAYELGQWIPLVGGPIFGIILGLLTRSLFGLDSSLEAGIRFSSKKILQGSIVALGGSLSLTQIWETGQESVLVMITSLLVGLAVSLGIGKIMKIPWRTSCLIGAGTSICGASAIAAVAPVVKAEKDEIAYSISTIFLFNIIAVFSFPLLGHLIDLTNQQFGLWAGTAINDTSSVVAAGFAWNQEAGSYATVVKLARATMIIPVVLGFAFYTASIERKQSNMPKKSAGRTSIGWGKVIPWFILGFLVMAVLNTIGVLGNHSAFYSSIAKIGIIMALVAVGLGADFGKMKKTGYRPLLLGLITWFFVSIISIGLILR